MPLHPDMQVVMDIYDKIGRPDFAAMGAAAAKEYSLATIARMGVGPEIAEVRDLEISGGAGAIAARLYAPEGEAVGLLIFFHGGGWVVGTLDSYDAVLRRLAFTAGIRILSVDYRLAPEHAFPAAIDDCVAATEWAFANAADIGAAGLPVAIGGDSAGGNLAAAAAIRLRDMKAQALAFQLLIFPVVDADFSVPSYTEHSTTGLLSAATMRWFWDQYVPDIAERAHVLASPLQADSLTGVAPALVELAGYDPLLSEGEAYVRKLNRDGVPVAIRYRTGLSHGYFQMGEILPPAGEALAETAEDVRAAFLRASGGDANAANRLAVVSMMNALASHDLEGFAAGLADDVRWRYMVRDPRLEAIKTKDQLLASWKGGAEQTNDGLHIEVVAVHGDGCRWTAEGRSRASLPDGGQFDHNFCLIFKMRHGRAVEVREYIDSQLVQRSFGG